MPDHGRARRHQGRSHQLTLAPEPLLLGLDLGTSSLKALLVDGAGTEHGCVSVATPFRAGEMTVDQLNEALGRLCRQLDEPTRSRVAAVGIAGLAESGAPLDHQDRALAPVIAWHDSRGAEVVERLLRQFGPDLERAIGQRLRTVSSVAKLGWLVDHGVGPVDCWLGVPELALHALTGCRATEFSLAARTGSYHVAERRYLPSVVEALGVGAVFPPVLAAGSDMGRVSPRGASWFGLPPGIPVTVAGHDHLAGLLGSGATVRDVGNSVGTAETVVVAVAAFDVDAALSHRVAVTVLPGGKGWALLASAVRSGHVVSAVAQALGGSPQELDARAVRARRIAVDDSVIDAAVRGEPIQLPAGDPGALWNGVLDALAARTWDAVDRLHAVATCGGASGLQSVAGSVGRRGVADGHEAVAVPALGHVAVARSASVGRPGAEDGAEGFGGLVVFGGGSRSRPWLGAKAAARPGVVVSRSGAAEAVARGAALCAGAAAGWWAAPGEGPTLAPEPVTW